MVGRAGPIRSGRAFPKSWVEPDRIGLRRARQTLASCGQVPSDLKFHRTYF